MKNPGKQLIVFLLLALAPLYAAVEATVDASKVAMGETVTFTVKASGSDVQRPSLSRICGEKITSSSQSTNIQGVNGKFTRAYSFSYVFMPTQECTIEPVTLKVDGKEERTEAIKIRVVAMEISKDAPFILEMSSDKKSVYVGEPFKVTINFKQRNNSRAVDAEFSMPEMNNFWTKTEEKERRFEEGDYTVSRLTYVVAAQREGNQTIAPAQIKVATRAPARDSWGQWFSSLKWRTYFSNKVDLDVKPLPQGVDLVGSFTVTATADKTELEANEAVNVTLKISGAGNFEDIPSQKPDIPGVTVFDEEGTTKAYVEQGVYKGSWTQKLAFISANSFIIPPFTLRYFDTDSQSIKTLTTEPIEVKVKNSAPVAAAKPEPLTIKRSSDASAAAEAVPASFSERLLGIPFAIGALVGLVIGMLLMALPWMRWFSKENERKKFNINDQKALLMLLLQHRNDPEAAQMAERLEANLYEGANEAIDKKVLKVLLKRIRGE